MAKVKVITTTIVELTDPSEDLVKVVGREMIAGISTSIDANPNVEDIKVESIDATVSVHIDCMPDEEISELGR